MLLRRAHPWPREMRLVPSYETSELGASLAPQLALTFCELEMFVRLRAQPWLVDVGAVRLGSARSNNVTTR